MSYRLSFVATDDVQSVWSKMGHGPLWSVSSATPEDTDDHRLRQLHISQVCQL